MNKYEQAVLHEEVDTQAFVIDDDKKAAWALSKIKVKKKQIEETNQIAQFEIDSVKIWQQTENKQAMDDIEYFEMLLRDYYETKLAEDPNAKIKTPHGTVSTRKQSAKIIYTDETLKEFEEKGLHDFIRVKKEINKAEAKKYFHITDDGKVITENGELIETALVEPEVTNITIRTK